MAEIKVIEELTGKELTETPVNNTPEAEILPTGNLLRDSIAQMFDLKPSEISKYDSKLDTLIQYAKMKTEDHSPAGLKWAIRSLGTKLGTPPLGEKLLPYLTRYAYLYLESNKIEKEMDKYIS